MSSLFTNVPLLETIQICADAFYSWEHPPAAFPLQIFVEVMEMAATSVEFSFGDIMHRQSRYGITPWTSPCQYFCWLV